MKGGSEAGDILPADKQPFIRGHTVGTAQATWLVPESSGASQLRDSAGFASASLASVPSGTRCRMASFNSTQVPLAIGHVAGRVERVWDGSGPTGDVVRIAVAPKGPSRRRSAMPRWHERDGLSRIDHRARCGHAATLVRSRERPANCLVP